MSDQLNIKQATAIAMGLGYFLMENAEAVGSCILAAQERLVGPDEPAAPKKRTGRPEIDMKRDVELVLSYAEFADQIVIAATPTALSQDERDWVLTLHLPGAPLASLGVPERINVRWTAERGFQLDTTPMGVFAAPITVEVRQEAAKPQGTG